MATSDNSKSISSSHTIPFSKSSKDAFHDMTAFSPPAESWIIQYPKKDTQAKKEDMKKPFRVPEAEQLENPCRQYIESSEIPVRSNKSLGTDDHFKSAACSKNLLKVCEKLMVNKEFMTNANDSADDDFGELSLINERSRMDFYRQKHGNRRASQSAPVSPKLERKALPESTVVANPNPYFTITKQEPRKESNIGFLTSLFGITAARPAEAKANLTQKYEHDVKVEMASSEALQTRKLTPKPHEYREMNMFSPTSM